MRWLRWFFLEIPNTPLTKNSFTILALYRAFFRNSIATATLNDIIDIVTLFEVFLEEFETVYCIRHVSLYYLVNNLKPVVPCDITIIRKHPRSLSGHFRYHRPLIVLGHEIRALLRLTRIRCLSEFGSWLYLPIKSMSILLRYFNRSSDMRLNWFFQNLRVEVSWWYHSCLLASG